MSHSTVTVVIRDAKNATEAFMSLEELLEPFNENADVTPYPEWVDDKDVKRAVEFYKDNPQFCDDEQGPSHTFDRINGKEELKRWTRQAVGAYMGAGSGAGLYDEGTCKYGYASTYNPKSRWDWWTLGGRWHGFYQLRPGIAAGSERSPLPAIGEAVRGERQVAAYDGTQRAILGSGGVFGDSETEDFSGRADLARKGDIDFAAMRTLAEHQAADTFDKYLEVTAGLEPIRPFPELVEKYRRAAGIDSEMEFEDFMPDEEDRSRRLEAWQAPTNQARQEWHNHPWVRAMKEANLDSFWSDTHEVFFVGDPDARQKFIERAGLQSASTFALLDKGEWIEQGRMGWFGIAIDEKDDNDWLREFHRHLDSLPDDVYLAVVDVHI